LRVATPPDYTPLPEVVADSKRTARETKAKIELLSDPREAVSGAQAVYTHSWTRMGFEAEGEVRNSVFAPYQANAALMALPAPVSAPRTRSGRGASRRQAARRPRSCACRAPGLARRRPGGGSRRLLAVSAAPCSKSRSIAQRRQRVIASSRPGGAGVGSGRA